MGENAEPIIRAQTQRAIDALPASGEINLLNWSKRCVFGEKVILRHFCFFRRHEIFGIFQILFAIFFDVEIAEQNLFDKKMQLSFN